MKILILWNIDPLLGNDREIGNYTTTVARHEPVNSRGMVIHRCPVSSNYAATEESCFECGPCRDVIIMRVRGWLVGLERVARRVESRCETAVSLGVLSRQ
jgi:hypothetical protein